MNGVAVYNRNKDFLYYVNKINNYSKNHDLILSTMLKNDNLFIKKTVDSKYILNITSPLDKNITNFEFYKKQPLIIHTKNNV